MTDLEHVVKLLDKVITSERKEVKEAFRELLIIVALTEDGGVAGPIEKLLDRQLEVESHVRRLENQLGHLEYLLNRQQAKPTVDTTLWSNSRYASSTLPRSSTESKISTYQIDSVWKWNK